LIIAFGLGTGLRQGEQWALETRDVHAFDEQPHITVRFGSPGMPTKNGRIRRVPLFGLALVTTRRWLQVLPTYASKNPFGLLFPTRMGARRRRGKTFAGPPRPERLRDASAHAVSILSSSAVPMTAMEFGRAAWPTAEWEHRETYLGRRAGTALRRLVARGLVEAVVTFTEGRHGAFVRYATTKAGRALLTGGAPEPKPRSLFRQYLETAGISRRVRWHDLRHSFASSLVAGLWGRPWRLEEVCKVMGHSSITVTERYAHLADDALKGAVLGTPCLDNLQVRERVDRYRRVMLRAVDRAHPPSRIAERACNRFPGDLVPVNGPGTWWWAGRSA
jgi:integrase